MQKRIIYTFVMMLLSCAAFAQVDRSKLPEPATPRPIELGDYETVEFKNGLKVFIIENKKLPSMNVRVIFDRLPFVEGDKAGFTGMFGTMLRSGTTTRTKEQLDEELDFIGARMGASSTFISISGLSKYQDTMLDLLADVMMNPTFPEAELEKARVRQLSGLEAAKDDPDAISDNLNLFTLYGKDHPYGELQTEETTNNITVDDFKNYHSKYFSPSIAHMAVIGDVDPKLIKKALKKKFGKWVAKEVTNPTYAVPAAPATTKVNVVNRSSSVQSVIRVAYPIDLPQGHPDVAAVRVMNQVFGASSTSRLFMNLREDKGYTYGAYSSISADRLVGSFSAGASVRNEVTDSAVTQVLYEMKQMIETEVTDEQMDLAKNAISGRFGRSLERPSTIATYAINTAIYGFADDYYATYVQRIQAVTKEDIKAVAAKYMKPENAHINIVGKGSQIKGGLKQFGEISYWDNYGNPAEEPKEELPADLTLEQVFDDYINAIGGKEKVASLKSMKVVMEGEVQGQPLEIELTRKSPGKSLMVMKMSGNVMNTVKFNGIKGSSVGMMGSKPIEGDQAKDMALETAMTPELRFEELGATVELIAAEEVNGELAYVVEVNSPSGKKSKRYYAAESKLLIRTSNTVKGPQGEMTMNSDLKAYMDYDGVLMPSIITQPMGPMTLEFKAKSVEINPKVDDKIFD